MKIPILKECKCGQVPKVCQWLDTKPSNATWVECSGPSGCGLMTKSFHSKDPDLAKKRAVTSWNKKAKKRVKVKGGLLSCEKCGSKNVKIESFQLLREKSVMARCNDCGLFTDEMKQNGDLRTEKEAKDLWNRGEKK